MKYPVQVLFCMLLNKFPCIKPSNRLKFPSLGLLPIPYANHQPTHPQTEKGANSKE